MNANTNANSTKNPVSPILRDLKAICQQHHVTPPTGNNLTLENVIVAFQQKIRHHRDYHPAASCTEYSGDYQEWKRTLNALHAQLNEFYEFRTMHQKPAATPPAQSKSPNLPPTSNTQKHPAIPPFPPPPAKIFQTPIPRMLSRLQPVPLATPKKIQPPKISKTQPKLIPSPPGRGPG